MQLFSQLYIIDILKIVYSIKLNKTILMPHRILNRLTLTTDLLNQCAEHAQCNSTSSALGKEQHILQIYLTAVINCCNR